MTRTDVAARAITHATALGQAAGLSPVVLDKLLDAKRAADTERFTGTRSPMPPIENPYEFYPTPAPFTQWLFEAVPIMGKVFEPCVGNQAILRVTEMLSPHRCQWQTNDLDPRWPADTIADATSPDCWRGREIDWTVTNPPFEPVLPILIHALQHSRVGVALHVRASFLEPLKRGLRRRWLRDHSPTGVLHLPRVAFQRSPTTGAWSTDSMYTVWAIWLRDTSAHAFHDWPPEWLFTALATGERARRAAVDDAMEVLNPGYRAHVAALRAGRRDEDVEAAS